MRSNLRTPARRQRLDLRVDGLDAVVANRDTAPAAIVERAREQARIYSKQPRFAADYQAFYTGVYDWLRMAEIEEPPYSADSRRRDTWLSDFWRREPHLAGVLYSCTSIDANRAWTLTGGRNQVYRVTDVLHDWAYAPAMRGYRHGCKAASLSFYTTDIGALIEIGRDDEVTLHDDGTALVPAMRALYHVDPTLCQLTGGVDFPLTFRPPSRKMQQWTEYDFIRLASMASIQEKYKGLAYCAVSRALELAKLMVAVLQHDQEMLAARAPRGFLILQNVGEEQWEQSLRARDASLDSMERKYYGGVQVLASSGVEQVDAKLIGLSQLPAHFDEKTFRDLLMYGYALVFGRDPSEFWPVQFGSLGRGTETEVQHLKATTKGGGDFTLAFQEEFQQELPDTIQFEIATRDAGSELLDAEVAQAWAEVAKTLAEVVSTMGLAAATGPVTVQQIFSLLAEHDVVPPEWTELEEEVTATDIDEKRMARERDRLLSYPYVRRAIEEFPDEALVQVHWPSGREVVLWDRAGDALRKQWVKREDGDVLYESPDGDFVITEADLTRAYQQGDRRLPDIAGIWEATTEGEYEPPEEAPAE